MFSLVKSQSEEKLLCRPSKSKTEADARLKIVPRDARIQFFGFLRIVINYRIAAVNS